jgi:hypothetical protein
LLKNCRQIERLGLRVRSINLSPQCPTDSSDPDDLALAPLLYHPHPLQSVSRTPPLKFLPGRKSQVLMPRQRKNPGSPAITRSPAHRACGPLHQRRVFESCCLLAYVHLSHPTLPITFSPSSIRGLHGVEAVDIFRLFLTDSLLNTISTNTNAYAQKKIKEQENSGARVWVEVKPQEIGAWIGIVLYMGVHRSRF